MIVVCTLGRRHDPNFFKGNMLSIHIFTENRYSEEIIHKYQLRKTDIFLIQMCTVNEVLKNVCK